MPQATARSKTQRPAGDAPLASIEMRECIFSHTRGTAVNDAGDTSRRLSKTVSMLSAKFTTVFAAIGTKTETSRSRTWHSGRKHTCSSPSRTGIVCSADVAEKTMFSWEIIAPLGWPVVPDV